MQSKNSNQEYKAAIEIETFTSQGRSCRVRGITNRREYNFLSDLEKNYFYLIDFLSNNIISIEEQYPLDFEKTQRIAKEYGLKHPMYKSEPVVMTTDFFITYQDQNQKQRKAVRTVKPSEQLNNPRTVEKLLLEQLYFMQEGISNWKIVTEKEIDQDLAKTIEHLKGFENLTGKTHFEKLTCEHLDYLEAELLSLLKTSSPQPIREICKYFDNHYSLQEGSAVMLYKHLLITKQLFVENIKEDFGLNEIIGESN